MKVIKKSCLQNLKGYKIKSNIIPIDDIDKMQLGKTGVKRKIVSMFTGVGPDLVALLLIFLYSLSQLGPDY